jgi:glycosyltransferase involved in cell wall biosynthesis
MNILYVTHELPFPAVAGHHLRTLEIISALPQSVIVYLVGYSEKVSCSAVDRPQGIARFEAVPGLVRIRRRPLVLFTALTIAMLSRRPYSIVKYPQTAMREAINRYCRQSPPDVIITSFFTRHMVPSGPWKVILDTHNIEHALWQSFVPVLSLAKAAFVRREARLLERIERAAWKGVDGIMAICAEDAAIIGQASQSTPVKHVPVRIAASGGIQTSSRDVASFDIGMIGVWSWAPNSVAMDHFARSVIPRLTQAGIRVRIAGKGLDRTIKARLERMNVDCPGHIPEVADFYRSVRIVAAPYTMGGGVRMKVAEALSWERPVIGTTLAFRGIGPGVPSEWVVNDIEDELCPKVGDGLIRRRFEVA